MINIIFYDFEVFEYDWLVVLVNPDKQTEDVIINDSATFTKYYEDNKDDIWVGKNNVGYDQFIKRAILCGFNPKKVNDHIIVKGKSGWQFSSMFSKIPCIEYDIGLPTYSLKQLEGFMGDKIKESSVDFTTKRKLTEDEIAETVEYCKHDVYEAMKVFMLTVNEFNASLNLINTFNLPLSYISKTKAQLSAIIIGCNRKNWNDEFDITIVDTLRIAKYKPILDWFKKCKFYDENFEFEVAGVKHTFGIGGVHGARENYHSKGLIVHVDVNSYYPSLMIKYGLLTRNCSDPKKYEDIYNTRLALKKEGKKKEQAPYKIVLNATYGIFKDKYSSAYDPRQANNVCVNGQLLLIDLIDKLEAIEGFELIQSNTDGLIVKIPDTDKHFNLLDDVCHEWEKRTGMGLGFDFLTEIWQKDVNNYIFRDVDGELERKGAYVKELNELDNNLPIVNKAIVDYLTQGTPIETTINTCDDLKQFQMICKITSKYKCLIYGNPKKTKVSNKDGCSNCIYWGTFCGYTTCQKYNLFYDKPKGYDGFVCDDYESRNGYVCEFDFNGVLSERCVRVFASKRSTDGGLYKLHQNKNKPDKFPSTPEHCFIENGDVNGMKVPLKLDREFYINMAKERASGYGII